MHVFTSLNNPDFVSIVAAIAFGLLLWKRCYPEAKIFVIDCAGGGDPQLRFEVSIW